MNVQLKHARFNLLVCGTALFLTATTCLGLLILMGPRALQPAFAFLAIGGLMGFGGIFYRKKPGSAEVLMDERDVHIRDQANLAAWLVVWVYWCAVCMGPWFALTAKAGFGASIRVSWLPLSYMIAMIVHQFAWSIAVVVQYRGLDRVE